MASFEHIVLVDFENVPDVDLASIEGKPVRAVLMIGARQRRLDLALVRQVHRMSGQIELIEAGANGRGVFDLALAYQLGLAVKEHPRAQFHIVSHTEDFEPLIRHLAERGLVVVRHDSFPALYLPIPVRRGDSAVLLDRVIAHLRSSSLRPRKRSTLEQLIAGFDGITVSKTQVSTVITQLLQHRVITIDDRDKVGYP